MIVFQVMMNTTVNEGDW